MQTQSLPHELHASKHASSKSLDNQSFLPSLCSKKPPLFFSSQSFLFLTLFMVLGVFFSWFSSSPSSSPYPPASSSSKPLEILLSAMHAADSSSSSSSSSSATHLPYLLTPAQTTESQNDFGSWEPLQTIASSQSYLNGNCHNFANKKTCHSMSSSCNSSTTLQ